jgi:hypothetical protein
MAQGWLETMRTVVIAFCGSPGVASDLEMFQGQCDAEKMDTQIIGVDSLEQARQICCAAPVFCMGIPGDAARPCNMPCKIRCAAFC